MYFIGGKAESRELYNVQPCPDWLELLGKAERRKKRSGTCIPGVDRESLGNRTVLSPFFVPGALDAY